MDVDHKRRDFDAAAQRWDDKPSRVILAEKITDVILLNIPVDCRMDAMDYGCGTGLVSLGIQPHVASVTAVDSSQGMLHVLHNKIQSLGLENVRTLLLDLEKDDPPNLKFHLITTSMVLHHVKDPAKMIEIFREMLHPGGFLAIADLDQEDGSYHQNDAGVHHDGFDRNSLSQMLVSAGFSSIKDVDAAVVNKEIEGQGSKEFTVFLISACSPGD